MPVKKTGSANLNLLFELAIFRSEREAIAAIQKKHSTLTPCQPDAGGHAARDGAGAIGVKKLRLAEGAPDGAAVVAPGGNAQRGQPLAGEGGQMGQPFAAGAGGEAGGGFRAGGGEGSAHFRADFKGVRADAGA